MFAQHFTKESGAVDWAGFRTMVANVQKLQKKLGATAVAQAAPAAAAAPAELTDMVM